MERKGQARAEFGKGGGAGWMSRKVDKIKPRGWEALKIMLRERGLTDVELEEAQDSFYRGVELLSELFLSCYLPEKNGGKRIKLVDKT